MIGATSRRRAAAMLGSRSSKKSIDAGGSSVVFSTPIDPIVRFMTPIRWLASTRSGDRAGKFSSRVIHLLPVDLAGVGETGGADAGGGKLVDQFHRAWRALQQSWKAMTSSVVRFAAEQPRGRTFGRRSARCRNARRSPARGRSSVHRARADRRGAAHPRHGRRASNHRTTGSAPGQGRRGRVEPA